MFRRYESTSNATRHVIGCFALLDREVVRDFEGDQETDDMREVSFWKSLGAHMEYMNKLMEEVRRIMTMMWALRRGWVKRSVFGLGA